MIVRPQRIDVSVWTSFNFTCISANGSRLNAVFKADGSPVDVDPRFRVIHYNASVLIISAPGGIRDIDDVQIE